MTPITRLAINGASGRMGRAILALIRDDRRFELVRAVVSAGSEHDGMPVFGELSTSLRYAHGWDAAPAADVVVDFSGPEGLSAALAYCVEHRIALVTGTTGIDAALEARLKDAAQRIAILRAANFSLGVAVLTRLLREAAAGTAGLGSGNHRGASRPQRRCTLRHCASAGAGGCRFARVLRWQKMLSTRAKGVRVHVAMEVSASR